MEVLNRTSAPEPNVPPVALKNRDDLIIYTVLRADLEMSPGKAASQTGHAVFDTVQKAPSDLLQAYRTSGDTQVVLVAPDFKSLHRAYDEALVAGHPAALVVERGHVMLPTFDGSPVVTACGIGPISRAAARPILRKFSLMK
jgi:peptidyl-tRNA hydrolase, PTH2 family